MPLYRYISKQELESVVVFFSYRRSHFVHDQGLAVDIEVQGGLDTSSHSMLRQVGKILSRGSFRLDPLPKPEY